MAETQKQLRMEQVGAGTVTEAWRRLQGYVTELETYVSDHKNTHREVKSLAKKMGQAIRRISTMNLSPSMRQEGGDADGRADKTERSTQTSPAETALSLSKTQGDLRGAQNTPAYGMMAMTSPLQERATPSSQAKKRTLPSIGAASRDKVRKTLS